MEKLLELILAAEQITLVAHVNPDGDAAGSTLGLYWALAGLGKQVTPVLHDPVPSVFTRFLPGCDQMVTAMPESTDLCILLDAASGTRTGFVEEINKLARAGRLAVIDHHPQLELRDKAAAYLHDLHSSSTAEILVEVVQRLGVKITRDISTCFLTGIYTDTGGFQHSNTSEKTLEAAAELLRRGGNLQTITRAFDQDKSIAGLRLLGLALERAENRYNGFFTVSYLAHEDFLRLGANDGDLPGIIGQLNNLPGSRFSLLLSEAQSGVVRGNLRSSNEYEFNVNRIGRLLGGGGHAKASGFRISGHLVQGDTGWKIVA